MFSQSDPLRGLFGIVLTLLLVMLTGHLLIIGKSFLLPIIVAVIAVYVLIAASNTLCRIPIMRHAPEWLRRLIILIFFLILVFWLGGVMVSTAGQVSRKIPEYQTNLMHLYARLTGYFELPMPPDINTLLMRLRDVAPLREIAGLALGSISSAAGLMFLVVIYATFLMGERDGFARKIAVALPGSRATRTASIIAEINNAISDYITIKTLINCILGIISFIVMAILGVDFALFWAVLITLLNYIPYVGSMLGVAFPVLLSTAQFESAERILTVAVLLTGAQIYVGNSLEPRMVGHKINMSPFVVVLALTLWSSIWGLAGAILAIPLTSIIAIIMANFASTKPFAVLLAGNVDQFDPKT